MKKRYIPKVWLEPWSIWVQGDTWVSTLRVCRSIDGRWEIRGAKQPWFGTYRDTVVHESNPNRYTHRKSTMSLFNMWCPYMFFWFQSNDEVVITKTIPVITVEE